MFKLPEGQLDLIQKDIKAIKRIAARINKTLAPHKDAREIDLITGSALSSLHFRARLLVLELSRVKKLYIKQLNEARIEESEKEVTP